MAAANSESDSQEIFEGEPVSQEDLIWLEILNSAAKGSAKAIEEAAKQIISLTTFSQGLYFAAISFGEVKKALALVPSSYRSLVVLWLAAPLLLWLIGLYFATQVFIPRAYSANFNSPDIAKETYDRVVQFKKRQLNRAHLMLTLGFISLLINVVGYLLLFPTFPASE